MRRRERGELTFAGQNARPERRWTEPGPVGSEGRPLRFGFVPRDGGGTIPGAVSGGLARTRASIP